MPEVMVREAKSNYEDHVHHCGHEERFMCGLTDVIAVRRGKRLQTNVDPETLAPELPGVPK